MKSSKVGAIVYATDQGLGYMARDFFNNGLIDKVFIYEHSSRETHGDWYPRSAVVSSPEVLLEECCTLLFFETPFFWKIIPEARAKEVKTVLMPMYECTRYPLPYEPDVIINPSLLDKEYYPEGEFIPVPVSVPWRLREKAQVFVHNAGNGGLGGRNGTKELIDAMTHVKSPIKLIIRSQVPIKGVTDPRIEVRVGTFDDIWSEGDVFIFPEKFNGLSLPLQEAFASGMMVMAGDRFPINTWLPKEPLIPVEEYEMTKIARDFKMAKYSPVDIALSIDAWYNQDISQYSLLGKKFGEENSWTQLKPRYLSILKS